MPRYTTSQTYTEGNTQVVTLASTRGDGKALVPASEPAIPEIPAEDEDLEIKLRRITEQVPVRISNTSGSSAGSGSGDFHQYRQMRRREQDRLARMEADYQRKKEQTEFAIRREARLKEAEERTAKRRAKRLKKKEKKKQKKDKAVKEPGVEEADKAKDANAGESSSDSEAE
ncbi:hypothetical protein SELMODRAFT_403186 [Selaginella moellendorffii]|uniref:PRKR-interacting protein 1 n=1 Tax=Selaginella moellendorffii TaxID=88036 RepID=D8QTC8_SELML|nr:PRKR-interacting protein 1 [Selaginella moellendorffii]EFJ36625.1 hypothetical protein SELMODRAFT_403186 [Selaginella moellendorffii]|eukprot:XP_002961365.1 PRKR-interacting protein 1 [Selaginella moellendorffii]